MFSHLMFFFNRLFVTGKDIGRIYKHIQSQFSTLQLKALARSSSASQTSSSIELTTTYVPSVRDKKQNNYVLCYQNSIQNDVSITNKDYIQYCDTERNKIIALQPLQTIIIMHNTFLPYPQAR